MTPEEFAAHLDAIGLVERPGLLRGSSSPATRAARFLRVHVSTIYRMADGKMAVPFATAALLRLMSKTGLDAADVEAMMLSEVSRKKR